MPQTRSSTRKHLALLPQNAQPLPKTSIDSLPLELLELTFAYLFSDSWAKENGRDLSLVCRKWTRPIQRYFLHSVKPYALDDFVEESSLAIRGMVRTLAVTDSEWQVSVEKLPYCLSLLPALEELEIDLFWDGRAEDLITPTVQLPNVKRLKLKNGFLGLDSYYWDNIISLTPNISTLDLICDIYQGYPWDEEEDPEGGGATSTRLGPNPADLPFLTHLIVQSAATSTDLDEDKLLSKKTLRQITHLDLTFSVSGWHRHIIPRWIPDQVGPHLQTLHLPMTFPDQEGTSTIQKYLDACPNISELFISSPFRPVLIPPSVRTVHFDTTRRGHYDYWCQRNFWDRIMNWEGIERVYIDTFFPSKIKHPYPDGLEVYFNGEPFSHIFRANHISSDYPLSLYGGRVKKGQLKRLNMIHPFGCGGVLEVATWK